MKCSRSLFVNEFILLTGNSATLQPSECGIELLAKFFVCCCWLVHTSCVVGLWDRTTPVWLVVVCEVIDGCLI